MIIRMSPQAKIIKSLLKITSGRKGYNPERVKNHRRAFERNMSLLFPSLRLKPKKAHIAGVPVVWVELSNAAERVIVYVHGGGFVFGSSRTHQQHIRRLAKMCRAKVLAIDYSLSPESPYPKALDEIQKVWEELAASKDFNNLRAVIMGDSAGGGLALASVMRFRDAGLPQPACVVLLSPALDATFSGESYTTKKSKDVVLNNRKLEFFASAYTQHHSRKIPFISPVYADLRNLPPLLVHVGSEEMVLSDSETIARHASRDGVNASLFVGDGMWHGWHFFAAYVPEARSAMASIAEYVILHTKS